MTAADVWPWLSSLALLISLGGTLYIWVTAGSSGNARQIEELFKRMAEVERRAEKAESDIRHMPDRDMVQRMEITLTEMRGQMSVLSERLVPVAAISERLQEFLLDQHANRTALRK